MTSLNSASFFRSVHELNDLPPDEGIEVAVAGRSNAGKSSAINALTNRGRLAFVSKTPGRTQQIVFFRLDDQRFLVDLPGYGFAGVPLQLKAHWRTVLTSYLTTRSALAALILIMDSRHPLTPLDWQMLDWFSPSGRPVHVLLSKCDKLPRQARISALREVRSQMANFAPSATVQLFSSVTREGLEEAEVALARFLRLPMRADSAAQIKTPG
jgi:GTP-binding protein